VILAVDLIMQLAEAEAPSLAERASQLLASGSPEGRDKAYKTIRQLIDAGSEVQPLVPVVQAMYKHVLAADAGAIPVAEWMRANELCAEVQLVDYFAIGSASAEGYSQGIWQPKGILHQIASKKAHDLTQQDALVAGHGLIGLVGLCSHGVTRVMQEGVLTADGTDTDVMFFGRFLSPTGCAFLPQAAEACGHTLASSAERNKRLIELQLQLVKEAHTRELSSLEVAGLWIAMGFSCMNSRADVGRWAVESVDFLSVVMEYARAFQPVDFVHRTNFVPAMLMVAFRDCLTAATASGLELTTTVIELGVFDLMVSILVALEQHQLAAEASVAGAKTRTQTTAQTTAHGH
jgi:hypothetical protein